MNEITNATIFLVIATGVFLVCLIVSFATRQKGLIKIITPFSFVCAAIASYAAPRYMTMAISDLTAPLGSRRIIGEDSTAFTLGLLSAIFAGFYALIWIFAAWGNKNITRLEKITSASYIIGGALALIGAIYVRIEGDM